jgi:membrane fusion protein (multidrug efflux system)
MSSAHRERVLASESVDLVTEAAGRIEKIAFTEGTHVKKNDLLVKINDDDLRAQLKKTELQIQLASDQEKRQKQLYEINGISKEQYDIALNQVNTLKADRENLITSIRKREIRSPFDGIVGLRYISEGGYVSQTTRIASIQKINPLKVDFSIPEKYADDVRVGDIVEFSSDETHLDFTGKLYAIEPKIDPVTRTLQLRALCDNKNEKIFPGAYVQIELRLKKIPDALMVPSQAIIPVLKGQSILVKRKGSRRRSSRKDRYPHGIVRSDPQRIECGRHCAHHRTDAGKTGDGGECGHKTIEFLVSGLKYKVPMEEGYKNLRYTTSLIHWVLPSTK